MPEADRFLAVIPARGGSKRLPRKNVLPLAGRPLIAWSIATARASGCFVDLLVSTDDPEIATVARDAGAHVPWLRPADLATDTATSVDVVVHAVDWYEAEHGPLDGVMLLQPTSPFRTAPTMREAVRRYVGTGCAVPVVGVSPVETHPAWTFLIEDDHLSPVLGWEPLSRRSQDLPPACALNGSSYLLPPARLRSSRSFFAPDMLPLLMNDRDETLDIDTEEDWRRAESLAAARSAGLS